MDRPFSRNPTGVGEQRTHPDIEFVDRSALPAHPCGLRLNRRTLWFRVEAVHIPS